MKLQEGSQQNLENRKLNMGCEEILREKEK